MGCHQSVPVESGVSLESIPDPVPTVTYQDDAGSGAPLSPIPPPSPQAQAGEDQKARRQSRKSIKFEIEERSARGEFFWKDRLPEPKKENVVVVCMDAKEVEDSKQEIGFVNQYVFIRDLGEGSSGEVKLVLNETDQKLYAVKILSRQSQQKRVSLSRRGNTRLSFFNGLPQEVAILKRLTHPNMVNLYEVIDDPRIDRLYLVFEYVPGTQFPSSTEMEPLPIYKARRYITQVVNGLNYCHQEGVCHGDIVAFSIYLKSSSNLRFLGAVETRESPYS